MTTPVGQGAEMVRPLIKRKKDGTPYTRPLGVEQLLAQVVTAHPATLTARAAITDRTDPQYLPMEVLVHLTRHGLRMQDFATANTLLSRLGERCALLLKSRVRETNAFDAAEVREQVVSTLYELFVHDLTSSNADELDFYEVRFNSAFATLRVGIIRKALALNEDLTSLDGGPRTDGDDAPADIPDLRPEADVLLSAENAQLQRLVQALPSEERQAIVWKYLYGLKTESTDPLEDTVATRCGVSGSEIRSRLRSAYARLKKRMEEHS